MSDARTATALDYEIGRKLRVARTNKGYSQVTLADMLGITFQQIQKYEKGANRIAASRLADIAAVLELPVTHFYPASACNPIDAVRVEMALEACGLNLTKERNTKKNIGMRPSLTLAKELNRALQ